VINPQYGDKRVTAAIQPPSSHVSDSAQGSLNGDWWDLTLMADLSQEDLIYWRLDTFGCQGMTSERIKERRQSARGFERIVIHAYVPAASATVLDMAALALRLRQDALIEKHSPPQLTWERLESEDWSTTWKQHWQAQEIGDHLLIVPAWLTPPATKRHILTMDPGMAFGTGAHATTQLCLEALEMRLTGWADDEVHEPLILGDVGCGSGILSIAGAMLGAKKVFSVDTDPLAVEATMQNCRLNGLVDQVEARLGSLEHIPQMVDGLTCNILADVILDMIPEFRLVVKEDGWLILSGILIDQAKFVSEMLENHDWVVAALWKRGEWCCLNVRQAQK
jgi:ribosomal protein L11 methyltransferase